ncbi:hypothetical protein LTR64_007331 [Lithohypha guttulata]|uniref:uncharacterized protein n=1 Tax=Lithohypha guttulata TaxID=1690604 RepID=UPI002DDF4D3D|nr:hypothetical protein LTR51_004112 [Lithohypha guttulata]
MTEKLPVDYANLPNKSILITGGASGLGLATATRFAEHGAYITLVDRNEEQGRAAEASLTSKGYHVTFIQADVTDWTSSVQAFKHAVASTPRKTLDGAFLFAGVGGDGRNLTKQIETKNPEVSLDIDPIEPSTKVVDINLGGLLKSAKLALHYFRLPAAPGAPPISPSNGQKPLFLVASLAGYIDYDSTHYCISKYGVRGLFRSLRIASHLPDSIFTVNLVAPGYTPTPMVMNYNPGDGTRQKAIEAVEKAGLFAPIEYVVQAASLCATRTDAVNGRSFGTWPHGWFDQMEDYDECFGGKTVVEHDWPASALPLAANNVPVLGEQNCNTDGDQSQDDDQDEDLDDSLDHAADVLVNNKALTHDEDIAWLNRIHLQNQQARSSLSQTPPQGQAVPLTPQGQTMSDRIGEMAKNAIMKMAEEDLEKAAKILQFGVIAAQLLQRCQAVSLTVPTGNTTQSLNEAPTELAEPFRSSYATDVTKKHLRSKTELSVVLEIVLTYERSALPSNSRSGGGVQNATCQVWADLQTRGIDVSLLQLHNKLEKFFTPLASQSLSTVTLNIIPEIIDRLDMHIETAGRNNCADLDTTVDPNHRAAFAPPEDDLLFSVPLKYVSDVLHGGQQRQEDGRD